MSSPPTGVTVALADEGNLYSWKATMEGPAGSPYAVSSIFSRRSIQIEDFRGECTQHVAVGHLYL